MTNADLFIPSLPHHCGSWIVTERATGRAVFETWSRAVAEKINHDRYEVRTALDHLERINHHDR